MTTTTPSLAMKTPALLAALLLLTAALAVLPQAEAQAVTISNVNPDHGPTFGGTFVTLTGTGFQAGAVVLVGGEVATRITSASGSSSTSLTFVTPPHAAGDVTIDLVNPSGSGTSLTGEGFAYDATDAPEVEELSRSAGSSNGGTAFTITGTGFPPIPTDPTKGGLAALATNLQVVFDPGGADEAFATVTGVTATEITAISPAHPPGTVDLVVINPDGQESNLVTDGWGFTAALTPTLTDVDPNSGPILGGTTVDIEGTRFAPGAMVTFDGVPAVSVAFIDSTRLQVVTPPVATVDTYNVVVRNPDNNPTTQSQFFTFLGVSSSTNKPKVTGVEPERGTVLGGTLVTLTGSKFHVGNNLFPEVLFDGVPADLCTAVDVPFKGCVAPSSSTLMVRTPEGSAPGNPDIEVDNLPSTVALEANTVSDPVDDFEYIGPLVEVPPPSITDVTPSGTVDTNGGFLVLIEGDGFLVTDGLPTVTIGGLAATVCTDTDAPIDGCDAPSSSALTVVAPTTGANTAKDNVKTKVTNIDGRSVESDATNNNGDDFDIAVVPDLTKTPTVAGPIGASSDTNGGELLTITGTNFAVQGMPLFGPTVTIGSKTAFLCTGVLDRALQGTTPVFMDGCPTYTPDDLQLIVVSPGAGSPTATADIKVQNPNKITSSTTGSPDYEYTSPKAAAPALTSASITGGASAASAQGGFELNLVGSNFAEGLVKPTITIGGNVVLPEHITVNGPTSITVDPAPAHASGAVDCVIKNPDDQSPTAAKLTSCFSYVAVGTSLRPSLDAVTPDQGFTTGGTVVLITGDNFPLSSATKPTVLVDGTAVPAANILAFDVDEILLRMPAHTDAEKVSIVVSNPDGNSASMSGAFEYIAPPPTLKSISPTSGPGTGGNEVKLTGTFSAGTEVFLGDLPGEITSFASGEIKVLAPGIDNAEIAVDVRVVDKNGQTMVLADAYTFKEALRPTFHGVLTEGGALPLFSLNGGQTVTINGNGLANVAGVLVGDGTAADTLLTFDGTAANKVVTSTATGSFTSTVSFELPNFAALPEPHLGPVDVLIVNGDGQELLLLDRLGYSSTAGAVINGVSPLAGPAAGGTEITISGANFAGTPAVTVGGKTCTEAALTGSSTIKCKTPAGSGSAEIKITISGQTFTFTSPFVYGSTSSSSTTTTGTTTTRSTTTTTTSGGTTNLPGGITPAEIVAANKDVEVDVTREGATNVVAFNVPDEGDLPAPPLGAQVWRSASPYTLIETLPATTDAFQDGRYVDDSAGATATAKYLVTLYYGATEALGFFDADSAPDTAVYPGTSSEDTAAEEDDAGGLPTWAWVLIVLGLLFLIVLVVILVARGRRGGDVGPGAPAQGYAWEQPSEEQAADAEWDTAAAGATHHMRCPACATTFTATGKKPLVTMCPGCGRKGVLR